ncbi:MAG: matrixin family metalloprotease [Candidatus Altiarchaeales archaeon]|nr:matrixin family metalloprotease [Candidatus Altiarchaeales archaeon]
MHCTITGDGIWDGNEVQIDFNTRIMADYTAYEKKLTAEHEIGHAYGLDHESGCVLMNGSEDYFWCGGTFPKSDDVNGVEAIY